MGSGIDYSYILPVLDIAVYTSGQMQQAKL